eukprot:16451849-Heterocapsa_arctica.AAC.1
MERSRAEMGRVCPPMEGHGVVSAETEKDEFTCHNLFSVAMNPTSVNTNVVQLPRPLSLGYDKMHEHGVTHDVPAVGGSYYIGEIVKAIGEAIIEQDEVAALPEQEEEDPQGAGEMCPRGGGHQREGPRTRAADGGGLVPGEAQASERR